MPDLLKVACLQMTSGPDIQENLDESVVMIRQAASEGAQFVATPENTCHIRFPSEEKLKTALTEDDHPGIPLYSDLAKELGIQILAGSFSIKTEDHHILNRSYLFSDTGDVKATYDKIHLFDVTLPNGEIYRESDVITAGEVAVVEPITPSLKVGLSICYDLRFAYLYRALAQAGANILCVPAAFTVPTGRAHWEALLRARAIETGSYVLAPAQYGEHENGRMTYGHSMIIDPWGKVLSQLESGKGFITADLDVSQIEKARTAIPALIHDRTFEVKSGA